MVVGKLLLDPELHGARIFEKYKNHIFKVSKKNLKKFHMNLGMYTTSP